MLEFVSISAIFRMNHFAGTRNILWVPCSLVRAPTTWSSSWSFSSVCTSPGARPGPAVAVEVDDPHLRVLGRYLLQAGERAVSGRVIECQQLIGVAARVHRRADPLDLHGHVPLLIEAWEHNRDIGGRHGRIAHGH